MRVHISITPEDLKLIDQYCYATGIKRSTFLTRSALKEIGVRKKDIDNDYPVRHVATGDPIITVGINPVPKPEKK